MITSDSNVVAAATRPSRERWLATAERALDATFFHTPYWQDLAECSRRGLVSAAREFHFSNGKSCIFPQTRVGQRMRGMLSSSLSTFGWCYGGPIAESPLSAEEALQVQRHVLSVGTARLTLIENPFQPLAAWDSRFELRGMSTHVLDLKPGFDAIIKGFSKGHRAAYGKARREGVHVERAEARTDLLDYLALYQRTRERWGDGATSHYDEPFFEAIFELARRRPELVGIWLARRDTVTMAGAIVFRWNGHVVYWHGVSDEEFNSLGASNLLLGELIRGASEEGRRWFDFNPSGGHERVAAFKRRFGAAEVPLKRGDFSSPFVRVIDRVRSRL